MNAERFYEIDLLRFVSALMVVIFHYTFVGYMLGYAPEPRTDELGIYTRYFYQGINFFFVISGFVILLSARDGKPREFFISRALRLYPAYWCGVLLTSVAIITFQQTQFQLGWSQFLVNLTLLQGGFGVAPLESAYWTLWVELKFYALILVMVWLKLLRFLPWLCALVLVISIVGLNTSYAQSLDPFVSGFPHWWGYFACGCIFYLIKTRGFCWQYGLLLSLGIIFCVRQPQVFSEMMKGWYGVEFNAWVLVICNLVFLALMSVIALRKTGLLRSRYFYYAGVLTYPLYLLHQNIGYMLFNALHQSISGYWLIALTILFFLIAAWLVHILVEKPMQKPLKRFLLFITRAPAAKPYAERA